MGGVELALEREVRQIAGHHDMVDVRSLADRTGDGVQRVRLMLMSSPEFQVEPAGEALVHQARRRRVFEREHVQVGEVRNFHVSVV